MADDKYDETRATARLLPNLEIEILHRRPRQGHEEHMLITIRAIPSFEAFSRLLEVGNPLLFWTRMMQAAWSPWLPQLPSRQTADEKGRQGNGRV